jgi:hypothetical protein
MERTYQLQVIEPSGAVISDDTGAAIEMAANQETLYDVVIEVPVRKLTPGGASDLKIQITDDIGNERSVTNKMLGPQ